MMAKQQKLCKDCETPLNISNTSGYCKEHWYPGIKKLQEEVARHRKALEFYATGRHLRDGVVRIEDGMVAREALEGKKCL